MALPAAKAAPAMPFASQPHGGGILLRRPSSPPAPAAALRLGPLFWPWEKKRGKKLAGASDSRQNKEKISTLACLIPLSLSLFTSLDGLVKLSGESWPPFSIPMGFGTWAWGNQLLWGYQESMDSELQECFNLALKNGINLFDTADSYGTGKLNGQSERLLGKFISEGPNKSPDDVVIATKFAAYPWRLTSGQFVNACKSSLDRLQIDRLGIGQLHWSTANYASLQERALWDGLVDMYDKGLVRAVGVSNYGPKQLLKIHSYLASRGVPLSSAQMQFSLLSMGDEQMELKTVCDNLDVRVIAYSPLGLGMLTGKYDASNLPNGPRSVLFRQILPGLESLLSCLKSTADRKGKSMSQVAINWCICKGAIPIPGVKTVRHVEDNLGALGWRLSPGEISELEAAAMECPKKMVQNIFQTA